MNLLILTSIILSVILGVGRMVDLALFTDAETGLCVVGSVWLRYAALAVAILLAVAAGRAAKPEARKLCSPCKPSGVMAVLGAGFMAATFVAKLALWDSSVVGRIDHGVPEPFLQRMAAGAGPELDEQELEASLG